MDFGFLVLSLDLEFKGKNKLPENKCGYIVCKAKLFTFFGPMGLGETLANFFCLFLEFVPDFRETNVYEPNFATFLVISILSL